jgi:hypothetical protein
MKKSFIEWLKWVAYNNHVESTFVIRTKEDLERSRCKAYKYVISLAILLLFASCRTPAIITKQQATCVYNDGTIAFYEVTEFKHLNRIITTYQGPPVVECGKKVVIKIEYNEPISIPATKSKIKR